MAVAVTAARVSYLSKYFDSLVDLVPSKNYLDPDEVLDLRSMKREERQQTKRAFKTQHKQAKRAKLDPDGEAHTTAAQRRQEAQEERFRPNLGALVQNHHTAGGKPGM
jgi:60S ribosome biogenesis protein Rrp14